MTKLFPSRERPESTESAWIRELAEPSKPVQAGTTEPRPYYGALTAAGDARDAAGDAGAGAHHAAEAVDATAPTTGPIARLSADQVDRLIHRLDPKVGNIDEHAEAPAADAAGKDPDASAESGAGAESSESAVTAANSSAVNGPVAPEPSAAPGRARTPLLVVAAVALCALTVGGGTVAAMDKTVSVVVDGSPRQITTLSHSVSGALAAAGITPGAHDAVAPAGNASISDGSTIVVDRGRLLTLTVDGKQRQIWTTARTVDEALTQLGAGDEISLSANRSRQIPLDGLAVSASTLHTVRVSVAGQSATSATSSATTVGQLLAAQQVTVGAKDRVTPAVTTPLTDGLLVSVDRVAVASAVTTSPLPQPASKTVADPALAKGTSKVVQRGHAGSQTISYQVTTVNGQQTAKREVARKTVVAPVPTVTHLGTKVAPAKPKSTFTYNGSQVFTNDTTFGVNWDGLAMCESTHNPKAINANPSAGLPTYGMFQFDLPTWESVGGSGNPIDASPEEQLMRAKLLYQSRGLEPWACRDSAH